MKSILISIRPEWVAKILNREKTIEIRKTAPKCELPITVYIYCTKGDYLHCNKNGWFVFDMPTTFITQEDFVTVKEQKPFNGKVVAKFTLKKVDWFCTRDFWGNYKEGIISVADSTDQAIVRKSCVPQQKIDKYTKGNPAYAWHISDLVIFDEPKELSEFKKIGYLEERNDLESHIMDVEGCNDGISEEYVENLYQELEEQFAIKTAPQSWCYVEVEE